MIQKLKKSNAGFTLVELIVVIAILGVLAAVLVPQYLTYVEKARVGVDEAYVAEVGHVMQLSAASIELLNNVACTVTFTVAGSAKTGAFSVTTPASGDAAGVNAALTAELNRVFPAAQRVFKSKTYKGGDALTVAISNTGVLTVGKIAQAS